MPKRILAVLMLVCATQQLRADPLKWSTPYGDFNLNLMSTEALLGYDAILKQSIGGASVPVYTSPKNVVALQIGAVAVWPVNGAVVEPYIAIGHDIAREIPFLADFSSFHLNAFGRYATEQGKAGVGVSASYSFGS